MVTIITVLLVLKEQKPEDNVTIFKLLKEKKNVRLGLHIH